MSKQSGLGDNLYVGGYDVSGDVISIGRVGGSQATLDTTGIKRSAYERIGGVRDGGVEAVAWWNPTNSPASPDDAEHQVFRGLPTADVILTYCRGTTQGSPAGSIVAKQLNYDGSRSQDGSYTFAVAAQANGYGLDWGNLLTAGKRTDTTATSPATGLDLTTASTAFGWQAFLHVFAFTGTSVTATIQDSADNSSFANLTGAAFTAVTAAPASQRLEGGRTATVRRYIRVITSGTFSNAVFAVGFTRNDVAVRF